MKLDSGLKSETKLHVRREMRDCRLSDPLLFGFWRLSSALKCTRHLDGAQHCGEFPYDLVDEELNALQLPDYLLLAS